MNERDNILARIREALRVPAPRPGHDHAQAPAVGVKLPESAAFRRWLPPGGQNPEETLRLFQKNANDLKAEFRLLETIDQLPATLCALRDAEAWTSAAIHHGELTDLIAPKLNLPILHTDNGYDVKALEACSVGVSQCDALIAQTGSVLLTSVSAGGRALSVLPPHHVVLAKRSQLLRDLPEAFDFLKRTYAPNYPSFISFITGPSRTGDIERILVLGAHGPKKLTIICA